jgi:hypothetical protein
MLKGNSPVKSVFSLGLGLIWQGTDHQLEKLSCGACYNLNRLLLSVFNVEALLF